MRPPGARGAATANAQLIASYWTLAGDTYPTAASEASPYPALDRIAAASDAGYRGMGFHGADLKSLESAMPLGDLRTMLDDHGIEHVELEILTDWYDGGTRHDPIADVGDFIQWAEVLGARHIKVIGDPGPRMPRHDQFVEGFAAVCRQAATVGSLVAIEFLPFANISSLGQAVDIVRDAGQANGGVLVDIWHMARGHLPYEQLRELGEWVVAVEINDAFRSPVGTLFEDTIHHRLLCGRGDLEVARFLCELESAGYQGPVGVEILSSEIRRTKLRAVAQTTYETAREQYEVAARMRGENARELGTAPSSNASETRR